MLSLRPFRLTTKQQPKRIFNYLINYLLILITLFSYLSYNMIAGRLYN